MPDPPLPQLVIIGAGGYGRETCDTARAMASARACFRVKGFLDSRSTLLDRFPGYPPILGNVEDYLPAPDEVFLCAFGAVADKQRYAAPILAKGGRFLSLIHPTAIIRGGVRMGRGCLVGPFAIVSCEAQVGDFVTIMGGAVVGHDCRVDDWAHLGVYVFLGGGAVIGQAAQVHTRATLLPRVQVGARAVVGAGSVVLRDVPPQTTVFGNPARRIPGRGRADDGALREDG